MEKYTLLAWLEHACFPVNVFGCFIMLFTAVQEGKEDKTVLPQPQHTSSSALDFAIHYVFPLQRMDTHHLSILDDQGLCILQCTT